MFGSRGRPERIIDGGSREAFQSFVRNQEVLAAINTVSIWTKLDLEGVNDRERKEAATEAKGTLTSFLTKLGEAVGKAEQGKPLLGMSRRQRQLARRFVEAKHSHRIKADSGLFKEPISNTIELVGSGKKEDREALVRRLRDLRVLVEGHISDDTARIFGKI